MNIVIVTHGELATGLVDSIKLIMGEQKNIWTCTLTHEMNIETFGEQLQKKILSLCEEAPVLVFTDLLLASPFNKAVGCYKHLKNTEKLRVLSGVSLPMVIEAIAAINSGDSLETVSCKSIQAGKDGITDFLVTMKEKDVDMNAL